MAAVEIGLAEFDSSVLHGFELTRDAAEDVFRTLATETLDERKLNPGLPADRADIIVAGCCILVATMRRLHLDSITVSTRSLMDGIVSRERLKP
jgi:exopolyphosphatase/guanosine-5'-triphosphate,3'-diphosphate pyrophosphatase